MALTYRELIERLKLFPDKRLDNNVVVYVSAVYHPGDVRDATFPFVYDGEIGDEGPPYLEI